MAQGAGGVAIGRRRDDQPPSEEAARETGRNQDLEVCNRIADLKILVSPSFSLT